ncbi:FAD:protein FMN transferase [Alicyclobacillus curvatus]|nr:FAD:protein FMN transferase [Alicyclobacillus curvatus]
MPRHEKIFAAMGSSFYICLDTSLDGDYVDVLMNQLVERTEQLEQRMSRFRVDSELVQLNQRLREPVKVSSTIREVLELAKVFMELSSGAFDPRVVSGLEGIGYAGAPLEAIDVGEPSRQRQESQAYSSEADGSQVDGSQVDGSQVDGSQVDRSQVDRSQLDRSQLDRSQLDRSQPLFDVSSAPDHIRLYAPVDLGGIGKGYTADRLADLIEASVHPALRSGYIVDAGGDIVISGHQETGEGFAIGIEDPFGTNGELAAALQLPHVEERMAICTSSLKRRSWEHDGERVHHILDPRRQAPVPTHLKAVTAVGRSAAYTEVFTKCTMISEGTNDYPWLGVPLAYVTIDDAQTLHYTREMTPLLSWISAKYQDARVVK